MSGEFTFLSSDGRTQIFVRRRDSEIPARGIVQIAHGIAEHSERYLPFMDFLAENGFIAVANDHLGHGRSIASEADLGCFAEKNGWQLAVRDMKRLHDLLREENPDLPYFLFGHSMGSFLTRTYIIEYPDDPAGAIICGTGMQPAALVKSGGAMAKLLCATRGASHKSALLSATAFGGYNKAFEPKRTEYDWLTRDDAVVDKYIADPLCGFMPSAGLFRDMMGGISFISSLKNMKNMNKKLPVLFISGEKDPVGENGEGVKKAYAAFVKAGLQDVSIRLYPECRHELLNELNRAEVMDDVLAWLGGHISGQAEE